MSGSAVSAGEENSAVSAGAVTVEDPDNTPNTSSSGGAITAGEDAGPTLNSGTYYIKEIQAPDGYYPDERIKEFTFLPGDDKEQVVYEFQKTLLDAKTHIEIRKDEIVKTKEKKEQKPLPGAVLQIIDGDTQQVVKEWTTADEAVDVERLTLNKDYILRELTAPDGYVRAEDIKFRLIDTTDYTAQIAAEESYAHSLTVHLYNPETDTFEDSATSTITMLDDYTKIKIEKRDLKTKKFVKGAVLQLKQGDTVVKEWTSGKKAEAFDYLPVGEYTLHEKSAPEGYDKADDLAVTVAETGEKQVFTMYDGESAAKDNGGGPKNTKKQEKTGTHIPQTGDTLRIILYLLAVVFLGGTLGFTIYTDPKRKEKRLMKKQAEKTNES